MSTLNGLQNYQPAAQVAGACLIFMRLCKNYGIHPGDAMAVANNVFTDGERVCPELRAVDDYINGELSEVKSFKP